MPYAQRQKPKLQLFQQKSSEDSRMSHKPSPSKNHRRTLPSTQLVSDDSGSSISVKSTSIEVIDPISGINHRSAVMNCNSPKSCKSDCECNFLLGCKDDISVPALALELIRELSFDTPRPNKTKKKAGTAGAVTSSSSSEMSLDHPEDHSHITSHVGLDVDVDLDLKHSRDLRARSLSPLLGLQYLSDHGAGEAAKNKSNRAQLNCCIVI